METPKGAPAGAFPPDLPANLLLGVRLSRMAQFHRVQAKCADNSPVSFHSPRW